MGKDLSGKLTMIEVVKMDVENTIRKDQTRGNRDRLETNKFVKEKNMQQLPSKPVLDIEPEHKLQQLPSETMCLVDQPTQQRDSRSKE